ncbi:MAG TPA: acyl carrier protein [Anaeromyxobacteraceae bacterium]|nr:acyl carrier protein [Anaeromyxobacteraceae bacterium]
MNVQARIRHFVEQTFYVAEGDRLADDASLIRTGIVDSTGVLEIISFLESEFGIEVEDRDAVPANLDSIARIAAFVARKSAVAGSREVA